MWNPILITACIVLFGCTSSDKKRSSGSDINVIVNVNNKYNDEYSAALADFYSERKFNATVGDTTAGTFVIGDLSADSNTVRLILRVYKGKGKNPCSNHIYDETGSSIKEGFNTLLNKIKANPQTPVCP